MMNYKPSSALEMPISHAAAYIKRNRATHSWYGDGPGPNLMSQSCPNARTLEDHMRQARSAAAGGLRASPRHRTVSSSPIVIKPKGSADVPSSSASSPGPRASYDGGFFVTANNAQKDFFVINPEWVSEGATAKKLSSEATESKGDIAISRKPRKCQISWNSYRRTKSAPPPKHRNPITWN